MTNSYGGYTHKIVGDAVHAEPKQADDKAIVEDKKPTAPEIETTTPDTKQGKLFP